MTIGDRVKFKTSGGWYNSGIIISRDEHSYLVEVDTLGNDDHPITFPYYVRVFRDVLIPEYEKTESEDKNMKLVSYEKCKDCEHYGVWSQRCWNVYECPKEVKIDAENESLSEAEREKILRNLYSIKCLCKCNFRDRYAMEYACDAADEIECIIKH